MTADQWLITYVGEAEKPCYRVAGPDGITGFVWSGEKPQRALGEFLQDLFGIPLWAVEPVPLRSWAFEVKL